ncbi:MAG TPA: ADOP family duplicated permease, partial [Bryobacteraceae bacterium]
RQRYHGDPDVLGRAIRVDADEFTIVGVMPAGFQFNNVPVDIWRTRIVDTRTFAPASVNLGASYLTIVGRLRGAVEMRQGQARLGAMDASYRRDNPGNSDVGADAVYADLLEREIFANVRRPLLVLWSAVGCLLIIACANVANLVLARATARNREVAVRAALGASRARIVRQLIAEGVLLSLCGALAALPVAVWTLPLLADGVRRTMSAIPEVHLDLGVMAATFAVAAAIGVIFGLTPVFLLVRGDLEGALHSAGRSVSASARSIRFREAIVAGEVALCLVLLTAGALLAQNFERMSTRRTGLRTDNVVIAPLDLMPGRYETQEARGRFYDEVLRRVNGLPGTAAAGITSRIDLVQHGLGYMVRIEGAPDLGPRDPGPGVRGRSVSPGYFGTLGIPLLRGRLFSTHDSVSSARVMIVNEAFARQFFPGQDAVGRHVTYSTDRIVCEIVGVVHDVRLLMQAEIEPTIYLPLAQRPWLVARLLVRTDSPAATMAAIRKEIQAVDPDQAVAHAELMEEAVTRTLGQPRTIMYAVIVFGAVALLLAAIGIYGVTMYTVAQRAREIGIRMALGATTANVRALVFRQSLRVLAMGLLTGVPLSLALSRVYASLLFEMRPADPATLAVVTATLGIVALAASCFPAIQAAGIDTLASLRAE